MKPLPEAKRDEVVQARAEEADKTGEALGEAADGETPAGTVVQAMESRR